MARILPPLVGLLIVFYLIGNVAMPAWRAVAEAVAFVAQQAAR